jgi:hypothetical protein
MSGLPFALSSNPNSPVTRSPSPFPIASGGGGRSLSNFSAGSPNPNLAMNQSGSVDANKTQHLQLMQSQLMLQLLQQQEQQLQQQQQLLEQQQRQLQQQQLLLQQQQQQQQQQNQPSTFSATPAPLPVPLNRPSASSSSNSSLSALVAASLNEMATGGVRAGAGGVGGASGSLPTSVLGGTKTGTGSVLSPLSGELMETDMASALRRSAAAAAATAPAKHPSHKRLREAPSSPSPTLPSAASAPVVPPSAALQSQQSIALTYPLTFENAATIASSVAASKQAVASREGGPRGPFAHFLPPGYTPSQGPAPVTVPLRAPELLPQWVQAMLPTSTFAGIASPSSLPNPTDSTATSSSSGSSHTTFNTAQLSPTFAPAATPSLPTLTPAVAPITSAASASAAFVSSSSAAAAAASSSHSDSESEEEKPRKKHKSSKKAAADAEAGVETVSRIAGPSASCLRLTVSVIHLFVCSVFGVVVQWRVFRVRARKSAAISVIRARAVSSAAEVRAAPVPSHPVPPSLGFSHQLAVLTVVVQCLIASAGCTRPLGLRPVRNGAKRVWRRRTANLAPVPKRRPNFANKKRRSNARSASRAKPLSSSRSRRTSSTSTLQPSPCCRPLSCRLRCRRCQRSLCLRCRRALRRLQPPPLTHRLRPVRPTLLRLRNHKCVDRSVFLQRLHRLFLQCIRRRPSPPAKYASRLAQL